MHSLRSALCFSIPFSLALLALPALAEDGGVDEDESGSPGVVSLFWADQATFNAFPRRVGFQLSNESYDTDPKSVHVYVDGKFFEGFTIGPQRITVELPAGERHDVHLLATDSQGRMIEADFVLRGGGRRTRVRVVDPRGAPVEGATVTASLSQDEQIRAQATTDEEGSTYFEGLPDCCVAFAAKSARGEFDSRAATPKRDAEITLELRGFNRPSEVDNNDFSRGLEGWETGDVSFELVPHREEANGPEATCTAEGTPADLVVRTNGTAEPQTLSFAKRLSAGTRTASLRYRFATCEVLERPRSSAYGTIHNDWYAIEIRAERSGLIQHDTNSVWSLGETMFDETGSTPWREIQLRVDPTGDVVRIAVTVANEGDASCDSEVIVSSQRATSP